jgi:hypothetical protein
MALQLQAGRGRLRRVFRSPALVLGSVGLLAVGGAALLARGTAVGRPVSFARLSPGARPAPTTIAITDRVRRADVRRFGINLGGYNHWDSGQIMANLLHRNPGFEGQLFRSIVRCAGASANAWTHAATGWTAGFWNGATFEVLQGKGSGRSGTITGYALRGKEGVFTLEQGSAPPAAGDWVAVRKSFDGGATTGWWTRVQGQGRLETESADLARESPGRQAVRLSAPETGDAAELSSHCDNWKGETFLRLDGSHRLTFRARGVAGTRRLQVAVRRVANPARTYLDRVVTLTPEWRDWTLGFDVAEKGKPAGSLKVLFRVEAGSTVLLDDVSLAAADAPDVNPTAFRLSVVHALRDLRPGIVRYWGAQLGETLDNQLAEPFARRRSGYSHWSQEAEQIEYGLHEFLVLCESVGAEPWYVIPTAFSLDEIKHLIEYLGGPTGTPYGDLRAARGHPVPWTETFRQLHLELGNEAWNGIFAGGTIESPEAYGQRGNAVFAAARASRWFRPASRFDLVLGGQAAWAQRNQTIHSQSSQHDSLALAPYLLPKVDRFAQPEEFFGPLFAEPELIVRAGARCPRDFPCNYMRRTHDALQASSRPVPLSVYEVNLHTTEGAIVQDQEALDRYLPSLGAGLAVAHHMLLLLRELGIRNQALFALHQFAYSVGPDKKTSAKLWGTVRDLEVTGRRRPQFLAVQLANEALRGDLVETIHQGDDPTWDQPPLNRVALEGAHYLHSYAFVDGSERSAVLFNLHRTEPLTVWLRGAGAPRGEVLIRRLSGALTASNEKGDEVAIREERVPLPEDLELPPHSMTALFWRSGGALGPSKTQAAEGGR